MKPIERGEILGLADYEAVRQVFRNRVIEEKKLRRVAIGPHASAVFENRDTVLLQIQEMLRTERITRAGAIDHEIETYNEILPGADELSLTVMIEIPNPTERDAFLRAAAGFERHLWLVNGEERIAARTSGTDAAAASERTTAVHYFKVSLSAELADALRGRARGQLMTAAVSIEVDHPSYQTRAVLPSETLIAIGQDLSG